MTDALLPPLPDQLFVLDRDHSVDEFLDMLLTFSTFGLNVGLLLVGRGVTVLRWEHRGIPVVRFQTMGLRTLMVEARAFEAIPDDLPDAVTPVDQQQVLTLYQQIPRILHP